MKIFVAVSIVFASSVFAQTPSPSAPASAMHPFTFEDMMKLKRLDEPVPSPDGKSVVFVSAVYPNCKDDACTKQRDDELKKSKVKAKIFTKLFYRHWNAFTEFKRRHLFAVSVVSGAGTSGPTGEPRDLSPGDLGVPPFHLGGQDMYAISPDGQELAYTSNIDEVE